MATAVGLFTAPPAPSMPPAPRCATITQAWNATCAQSGSAVSCADASYNGSVPDGGSVTFGFNASWSGGNPVPAVTPG
ncbi:hypothetical protein FHS34_002795 [Streptomyces echinatus]|uniref:CBM2 domain-containing protein n=1 Tax=Streptomyces echinatus TaxID=67293 RepID=A0A7W9PUB7_9ACTN|nr:hypothetical protein [Streptomyces echinatus]